MAGAVRSFEELLAFFADNRIPHQADVAHRLVEVASQAAPLPGNLLIKWEPTLPFVQVIHVMIDAVPEDRAHEVEAAMARLNNLLEVGGFGLDHERRRLYCQLTVPSFAREGLNPMTLIQIATRVVRNGKEFVDAFGEVVAGRPGAEIVEICRARRGAR